MVAPSFFYRLIRHKQKITAVDLLTQDWLGFAFLDIAGAGLLIPERLNLPKGIEIALAGVLSGYWLRD